MFLFKSINKALCWGLVCAFLSTSINISQVQAGEVVGASLPAPGSILALSSPYNPSHLMGMTIHADNPLRFDFLIHKGDETLSQEQKKAEYTKLIKYFLASLTTPDQDQWVNLSPYEHDRIIADDFGKTEMGRDLLAQDYILKQLTSSLMYPESGLGKEFWDRIYAIAYAKYGKADIPVNAFNKVWIVPDKATVYESKGTAYIIQSHLKVMLEEDYVALNKSKERATLPKVSTKGQQNQHPEKLTEVSSQIIREIILPELQREVNEGKNFAQLRQIVSGMILATWYKKVLKESLLGKIYADKAKVKGVDQDPKNNEQIYQQYLQAFKKGVYNYIKEDEDKYTHKKVPRKYFSGGFNRSNPVQFITSIPVELEAQAAAQWSDAAQTIDRAQTNVQPTADIISLEQIRRFRLMETLANVDAAMQAPQVGKRVFASEQDKFWIEKLYPTWAFQAVEFEGLLEKIDPLLRRLGQSKDHFKDINEAIAWLNRNIEPYHEYVKYSREHGISEEIGKLIPENWDAIITNDKDLRRFALTIEGQRLKRAVLGVLFSNETPQIVMANADEMKHARQYIDEKFTPMFRKIAIRNYYLARFISERFLGVKFDQDLNEIIQETHLYGLSVLQRFYSNPRIQSLNAYVYMAIMRNFSEYLRQMWGLPDKANDNQLINELLQSISQIIEDPVDLYKDKIFFSADDIIAQLRSKQFLSRWVTVLRIRRYIQYKNKMGTHDRFENPSVFQESAARRLQEAIAASLASAGDHRHVLAIAHGYGLFGRDELTLEETGKLPGFNVTRERVRQMQAKTIRRMRLPSRIKRLEPFVEEYEDIGEPASESLSTPQVDSLTEALNYLDYKDEELIVRLHGMDGNEPLSYEEIGREFALSVQEVQKAEERILSILSNKTDFSRDYLAAAKFAYLDRHRTLNPQQNAYQEPQRRTMPLTFEQEDELLNLLNIRGGINGFQWRVLPWVLKGYSLEEIAAVTNRAPEIVADARTKVLRKLRFVLNLDMLDQFGPRDQIIEELIRLSSESLLQRLFRRTDMDELLAISQGDVEGIIEFIMQLYPGMYKEEEIRELARAHYKGVPSISRSRTASGTPPKEVLHTMHDVVARFNLNNTRRNRLVLRRLMRDRYYQTIVSNPKEGLSQLQTEIITLGKSKNPKDALWVALLKETYEYYHQVADFYPRGFEENTEYGKEPLQAAQRYGIWEALQTLENPEFESAVHMSEARIGKTVMSVLSAYNIRNAQKEYAVKRVLFTTSNQAKFEAFREIKRRTNKELNLQVIVIDADPKKPSREEQIRAAIKLAEDKTKNIMIIANYETVRDFPELIDQFQADAHIIDEIENLKAGGDTKRAPIILGRPIRYRIGISARPIINSAEDIVELLLWARHKTFAADGRDIAEARAYLKGLGMDELFEALDPIKVRWRRKIVMPEVKDPIQEVEYIDFSPEHEKVILDMRDDFVAWKKTARSDKDYVDHVYTRQELERQASLDPGLVLSENVLVFTNKNRQSWTFEGTEQNFVIDGTVYKKISDFNGEIVFQDAPGKNVYRVNLNDLSKPIRINGILYTVENHKKNFMNISAKIKRLDQIIEEEVRNNGKVVIMVESVEEIQRLMSRYNDPSRYGPGAAVGVYGEVLLETRLDDIWRFRSQQRPIVLIGTTATIGSSINLFQVPGSSFHIKTMVRLSRPWANVDDADRLVGIGQHEQVRAITLVSRFREETQEKLGKLETIEERMETLLKRKRGIAVRVIDGVPQMSDADRQRLKLFADTLKGRSNTDAAMNAELIIFSVPKRMHRSSPKQWSIPPDAIFEITRIIFEESGLDENVEKELMTKTADAVIEILRSQNRFPNTGVMLNRIRQVLPYIVKEHINSYLHLFDAYANGLLTFEKKDTNLQELPSESVEPGTEIVGPVVDEVSSEQTLINKPVKMSQFSITGNGEYSDLFKLDIVKRLFLPRSANLRSKGNPRIMLEGVDDQSIGQAVGAINIQENVKGRDLVVLKGAQQESSLTILLNENNAIEAVRTLSDITLPFEINKKSKLHELDPNYIADMKLVYSTEPKKRLLSASVGIYVDNKRKQKIYVVVAAENHVLIEYSGLPIDSMNLESIHKNIDLLQRGDFLSLKIKEIINSPDDILAKQHRDRLEFEEGSIYKDLMEINLRKSGASAASLEQIEDSSLGLMIVNHDAGSSQEEDGAVKSKALAKLESNGVLAVTRIYNNEENIARLMDIYVKNEDQLEYEGTMVYPFGTDDISLGILNEPLLNQPRDIIYREEGNSRIITNKYTYQRRNWGAMNLIVSTWFKRKFGLDLGKGSHVLINYGVSFWGFDAFEMKELITNPGVQMMATELESETFDRVVVIKDREIVKAVYASMKKIYKETDEVYLLIKNGRVVEIYEGSMESNGKMTYGAIAALPGSKFYANGTIKPIVGEHFARRFERMMKILDENSLIIAINQINKQEEGVLGVTLVDGKWRFSSDISGQEQRVVVQPSLGVRLDKVGIGFQSLEKGQSLNVQSNSVSLILASHVLIHMSSRERNQFYQMLKYKLKEGGIFIASGASSDEDIHDEIVIVYKKVKGDIIYQGAYNIFRRRDDLGKLDVKSFNYNPGFEIIAEDPLFSNKRPVSEFLVAEGDGKKGGYSLADRLRDMPLRQHVLLGLLQQLGMDFAMNTKKDERLGGIDLNASNLAMTIKRNDNGVPLPLSQQNMSALSQIQGFEPSIIDIQPADNLPIVNELAGR